MNLTDLAQHICAQCGMNDADDVSAAKIFLQRRLEMIWNGQLWRSSLIEATMTINPDGTCSLSNTVWIPQRATLLLPPEFESVLAVRANNHTLCVASLESYYQTDTDWLNMNGDPFEFQVLSPAFYEFSTAQEIYVLAQNGDDAKVPVLVKYSPDGVAISTATVMPTAINQQPGGIMGTDIGSALRIISVSKAATVANLSLQYLPAIYPPYAANTTYVTGQIVLNPTDGNYYTLTGVGGFSGKVYNNGSTFTNQQMQPAGLKNGAPSYSLTDNNEDQASIFWGGAYWVLQVINPVTHTPFIAATCNIGGPTPTDAPVAGWTDGGTISIPVPAPPSAGWTLLQPPALTIPLAAGPAPSRQRIRLTVQPQLATNLRVLGKTTCPILGDYDTVPINNAEPCLMAYARGDMLLRARQHGKAQIAQQEGAALLAQLARLEAFQQAGRFQIQPADGFGGDDFMTHPSSLHPL